MESKEMIVANLNLVFGKKEDPLIEHIDDIIIPSLTSGIERKASDNTKYIFEDVKVQKLGEEYVIRGVLIKDTILDVLSEYSKEDGLRKTNKHLSSAPYSVFIIYLKNHRMVLVKNQNGSPNIRNFSKCLKDVIKEYTANENEKRRKLGLPVLPHQILNISGIKTAQNVKEALRGVEKITEVTFQLNPLNGEWDFDPIFGGLDDLRKIMGVKRGRLVMPSPKSFDGVAEAIENTEGLAKTKIKVEYTDDLGLEGKKKRTGTIKDNEISDITHIDIENELNDAYEEINAYKKEISALNVTSKNNIVLYDEFLRKKGEK